MLSGMSVLGAALASWNGTDGVARLKCKKEQPPRPLIKSSGLDPVSILAHMRRNGHETLYGEPKELAIIIIIIIIRMINSRSTFFHTMIEFISTALAKANGSLNCSRFM